jgi:hypothetical protein
MTTEPGSELTMVVSYADNRPHGQMGFGRADQEGSFVWRWVVSPAVPPGTATVLVVAYSEDGERRGGATKQFEVTGSEGC